MEENNDNPIKFLLQKLVKEKSFWVITVITVIFTFFYVDLRKNFKVYEKLKSSEIIVEVSGAVATPGVYKIKKGDRVSTLLDLAGGLSKDAYYEWVSKQLNLSTRLEDSEKVYIPFIWEKAYESEIKSLEVTKVVNLDDGEIKKDKEELSQTTKLNINNASLEELDALPGIGKTYAEKILNNAPYKDLQDFVQMSGVPEGTINKFSTQITFE